MAAVWTASDRAAIFGADASGHRPPCAAGPAPDGTPDDRRVGSGL